MPLHEFSRGEHHVSAPGGETGLVPQQILYRDEIVIVVPDVRVVLVQYAEGAEDGGVQEHLPFFLQPHDAHGREQLGHGG